MKVCLEYHGMNIIDKRSEALVSRCKETAFNDAIGKIINPKIHCYEIYNIPECRHVKHGERESEKCITTIMYHECDILKEERLKARIKLKKSRTG